MIKDYVIIKGITASDLQTKVNLAIKEGLQRIGGICWANGNFYQAMAKS